MANQPTKYKKFLAGAASATLVATAIVPTALAAEVENAATDFSDVAATHTHYAAIMQAVERGLFDGYTDGTFKPENSIDRKGVAKSLAKYVVSQSEYKTFEEYITANKLADKVTPFNDVPATHGDAELFNASLIVKDAGIFTGSNNNLMPGNVITRQQMAKALVNGFGLKDLAGVESEVTDTDKAQAEYVNFINILSENNVTEVTTFNPTGAVKRGQMASFLNRSYDSAHQVVAPETATKVVSVSATNLKEITVTFDGNVDKVSAEDVEKYSVDSSVVLESATLLEDGKTVRLTVEPFSNGLVLQNQKEYKLSVKNVKAGDKFVDATNVAFTPVDNTLPEVSEVKSLGTKAVKVTFSEPVKAATATNFKLDGKSYFGSVSEGSRSVILKPYTASDLAVGAHTLVVTGVEDYAGFKSLTKEFKFDVVEDTAAPTVSSVSATLEKVTVTFSEEVDPETVLKSNIYWKSGADKKAADSVKEIAPNVYEFDFTTNALPGYETTLFVEGVKDYSGNAITQTEVKVQATVDQTRPEVTEASISKLNSNNITLKFNKSVKIDDIKYFTLTDSEGDAVAIRSVAAAGGGTVGKEFTISTYGELSDSYTLKVIGVRDTTKLQNTMNDYSAKLTGKDTAAPGYTSNSANSETRTIIVNFDEKMELASLADTKNYLVTINGKSQQLPAGTEVTPVQDGNAVRIVFPQYIDNATVGINDSSKGANVTAFKLLALKDLAGNIIADFGGADILANTSLATLATRYDSTTVLGENAKLTGKGVVKVKFNQPIGKAIASDFVVTGSGVSISSVTTDGSDVVTINLAGELGATSLETAALGTVTLAVKAGNNILTTSGNRVVNVSATPITVKDTVKPQVQLGSTQTRLVVQPGTDIIELPFSENLLTTPATVANYAHDLVVTNVRTGATVAPNLYVTTVAGNKILIDFVGAVSDEFKVSVKANASFIQDATGNKAVSSSQYLSEVGAIDTVVPSAPTVTAPGAAVLTSAANYTLTGAAEAGSTVNIYSDANNNGIIDGADAVVATDNAASNGTYSIATPLTANVANDFVVTATDAAGNVSATTDVAYTITHDTTAATVTTQIAAPGTLVAPGTHTLVFSEALDTASLTNVKAAVDAAYTKNGTATATSAWGTDNKTLTVTYTAGVSPDDIVFAAIANQVVTDLAGNTSLALDIQQ